MSGILAWLGGREIRARQNFLKPEIIPQGFCRPGLIHGIEVQAGCAVVEQLAAQLRDHLFAKGDDALPVVTIALQPFPHPTRNLGATHVGKTRQLAVVNDGHNAGDDGQIHALFFAIINKTKIGITVDRKSVV